ncbi:hypothetical protein ACJIZ3_024508 [Penstemon smallii]|uniref:RING-type E3 ubiquitin transferase n=1 Tax=Penstemon smallii TaxID=265156 RepID=A0ABD3TUJ3_9LAMI
MDVSSESNLGDSESSNYTYDVLVVNNSSLHALPATCVLCQRNLSSDDDLVPISLCGDCKFLLLEDLETTSPDVYSRRTSLSRRARYGSSESIESLFSQQFSQMINLARQTQSTVLEQDDQSVDGDGATRLVQHTTSTRTTPSGSRRWSRVLSDTESDGFDSLYGDTESNFNFRRYRLFHGEGDTVSHSAYGGDSDASFDGRSFLENENFGHPDRGSDLGSDTDIDPMNAGLYHWNSEDQEEDEDDSEWEEDDIEGNTIHGPLISNGSNDYTNWRNQILPPEVEVTFSRRLRDRIQARTDFFTNFEETEYTENSRRGAPPTAASFIKHMPRVTIKEDQDNLACAICKDSLIVGTVVNQLPCFHFYHPTCILPWLSARNTCPICRYELPTDDKDYEERKRNRGNGSQALDMHQLNVNEDSYLDEPFELDRGRERRELDNADSVGDNGPRENPRNRWLVLAAPIVSVVGISLMLLLGKPSADGRWPTGRIPYRRENGQRRWWSFF